MRAEPQLLSDAVRQKNVSKKQSLLQKLFAVWFDAFVYNQIWEDPQVDLRALQLDANSRVLTISSGGCNALNYLLANPETVTAVDLNRHHVFLLDLKIAALEFLPDFTAFFNFFGFGKSERNVESYYKFVAPNLSAKTREYWNSNSFYGNLARGARINIFSTGEGLYENSRNARFLRFFHKFARFCGSQPEKILEARSFAEQKQLYEKYVAPFFDSLIIQLVGKMPITLFGLGIPPQQYEELKKESASGNLIDIYRERVHRLATAFPIAENYFAWQAFARRYDTRTRRAVPEYLKAENYKTLKQNAGKISTQIGSVTDIIRKNAPGAFNRFVFLDAQDWMSGENLIDLWSAVAAKGEKNSRVIFRTAGATSPTEKFLPQELREKFIYEESLSKELFKQDRAAIYGGFHLYILR